MTTFRGAPRRSAGLPTSRLIALSFPPISPLLNRPAVQGCRGGSFSLIPMRTAVRQRARHRKNTEAARPKESKMPKLKTKSGAKKRFKITGTGKVMYAQAGKRHGMIKRTNKQIRNLRGTTVMFKTDGDNVKKYFLPNG
jgi:large subunit ribosomal protein L35